MFLQYVSISGFKTTTTIHFKKTCVQRNDTKSHQTYQKKSFFPEDGKFYKEAVA